MEEEYLNKWSDFPGCSFSTLNKDIKDKILDKTLNPNEMDSNGKTLLFNSINLKDFDMVNFLLTNTAQILIKIANQIGNFMKI